MPVSAKAVAPATRNAREGVSFVAPAKAGVQGDLGTLGPWIPAFAGMTGGADHRRLEALAGAEPVDQPPVQARGKLCGKSRARSAATRIKAPPPSIGMFRRGRRSR